MVPFISLHTSSAPHPLLLTQLPTPNSLLSLPLPHQIPLSQKNPLPHFLNLPKPKLLHQPKPKPSSLIKTPNSKNPVPGGYKRPEIKVPNIVLQLDPHDVLDDDEEVVLGLIDQAVSKWVGVIILNGREANGGKLYEAACKLKSVVKDRAYLLISERVDIAAAADASGILLSDQGLPTIMARSTMMASKSDSVVLPLVARNVQDVEAAVSASSSEGAYFLIYGVNGRTMCRRC